MVPPPPPATAPTARADPLRAQAWQGEPQGTAGPPEADAIGPWTTSAIIIGAFLLLAAMKAAEGKDFKVTDRLRALISAIGRWRRRSSALLIVAGAGIVAAALTILQPAHLSYDYRKFFSGDWLAFMGVAIALIGFYDKLRSTDRDKI